MAAIPNEDNLDSRVTCSVCLEYFTGRQPKILPCFHSFCLPCLSQLVQPAVSGIPTLKKPSFINNPKKIQRRISRFVQNRHLNTLSVSEMIQQLESTPLREQQRTARLAMINKIKNDLACASQEGAGHEAACSTLTCPICRKVVPVPSGGVAQFQSNFYIADDKDQTPPTCQLCEGEEEVHHHCNKCGDFCIRCHRVHAKVCSATVTSLLNTAATQPGSSKVGGQKGQSQVEAMVAAIRRIEDNVKEVGDQREALEEEAQTRYMQGSSVLTQSRDHCPDSLRKWGQAARDWLQEKTDLAQKTRDRVSSLPALSAKQHWTSDPDVQRFERCLKSNKKLPLTFEHDDRTTFTSTQDCMKGFMGKVVMRDEAGSQQGQGSHSMGSVDRPAAATVREGSSRTSASNVEDMTSNRPTVNNMAVKLEALSKKISSLEADLKAVKQQNRQLQEDTAVLKREKQALTEDSVRLRREMSTCREGMQALKDKNSLLCQDLALLQAHNIQQVTKDVADLQQEVKDIACKKEMMVSENSKLKVAVSLAESKLSSLQTQHDTTLAIVNKHLATARPQVTFHVLLDTPVKSVKTTRVLILKEETINTNNCYNTNTGYFTAPVSGMYLFMASAVSCGDGTLARLDIVHEGNDIAYVEGESKVRCSGHVATRVLSGERVWLSTHKQHEDEVLSYQAGSMASFCGVLIQPDF